MVKQNPTKKSVKVFINGTKCIFKFSRERSKTKTEKITKRYLRKSNKLTWNKTKNLYLQDIIEAYNPYNNLRHAICYELWEKERIIKPI